MKMSRSKKVLYHLQIAIVGFIIVCLFAMQTAWASPVQFDVQVPSTSVTVGDTVNITVSVSASEVSLGSYRYEIVYDSSLLQYVSGGSLSEEGVITLQGNATMAIGGGVDTFTFKALSAGTASIETTATEIFDKDGNSLKITPAYNSITISDIPVSEAATEASTEDSITVTDISSEDTSEAISSEEGASDSEADADTSASYLGEDVPEGTIVKVRASRNTYCILEKPADVDVPASYLPVRIKLNDVDVRAYMKSTDNTTVLLYAQNGDGYQGWYFFNTDEGTFLKAADIIESSDSLTAFISKHKFTIMLIAIIVLVILVIVIIILAVSFKGLVKDYEAQIERLKHSGTDHRKNHDSETKVVTASPVRMVQKDENDMPTINNKALFPSDDEIVHETYADSDYDNQVTPDEDDFIHTDDYDESAFGDMGTDVDVEDKEGDKDSMKEIEAALESAKKYKK